MWNDTDTPIAYFISFRTYGTWLHGDKRGSIDRSNNRYGSPYLKPNALWRNYNERRLKHQPLILKPTHRQALDIRLRETCTLRDWKLFALNVRTNHVHSVVTAMGKKAGAVLGALKANATDQLKKDGVWCHDRSPWADRGSKRKLWNEESLVRAIDYVLYGQDDDIPDF
jgi:REP element-mobilizing transposase RayT